MSLQRNFKIVIGLINEGDNLLILLLQLFIKIDFFLRQKSEAHEVKKEGLLKELPMGSSIGFSLVTKGAMSLIALLETCATETFKYSK